MLHKSSVTEFQRIFLLSVFVFLMANASVVNGASTPTLDNGQSGTSSRGTWIVSGGTNPYGSNSLYSRSNGASYTFNVNLDAPGEYEVFAWWTEYPSRRTSVPYDINHLGGTDTVSVNQRQGGGQWNQLGNTWNFGSTATITLRSLGDGSTSADAIMLVPTGQGVGAPNTADNIFYHNFNNEDLHTYTLNDLVTTWSVSQQLTSNDSIKIVQDPVPSGSHGHVMKAFYAANTVHNGNSSGFYWRSKIGSHDEMYFAYDVYFEDDAEFTKGGKLPGLGIADYFSAAGVKPDGTDRWTGGLAWGNNGAIYNYVYHANQRSTWGDSLWWNDGPDGQVYFQKGKWNRVEIYYKMNTPGVLDGRIKGWLNGKLALDTNRPMFRMPGGEHLTIGAIAMASSYGGDSTYAPTTDQHIYFDNFVVSTQPITH